MGVNWQFPKISDDDDEGESATSFKENGNGGYPELVQGELPDTSTDMDIGHRKKFYRAGASWGSAISN